jgi:hypothetical protein
MARAPALATLYHRVRLPLHGLAGAHPRLHAAWRLHPRTRSWATRPDTELVIEGYARSANTFSVTAFEMAQTRPVKLAHHLHIPSQVILAVERSIPTLVLVRAPADAVLSRALLRPAFDLRQMLLGYIRFHERLMPWRPGFVIATFDEVTRDFGAVIRRVNARFATRFTPFEHTPENASACFDEIGRRFPDISAMPSEQRARQKERLRAELERHGQLLARAEAVRARFLA